jgi:hypothetical protein
MSATLLSMMAAAVFSIPIVLSLELIIEGVIMRPAAPNSWETKVAPQPVTVSNIKHHDVECGLNNASVNAVDEDDRTRKGATHELMDVMLLIIDYRNSLSEKAKQIFDERWGFTKYNLEERGYVKLSVSATSNPAVA